MGQSLLSVKHSDTLSRHPQKQRWWEFFYNAGTAVPIRHIHPQPATPLKTNNSMATCFLYDNIHQKQSKSWDIHYHFLRNQQTQQQFKFFWEPGTNNNSDYFTKHHNTVHHWEQRPKYVRDRVIMFLQRRCSARVCWYVTVTSQRHHRWHHWDIAWPEHHIAVTGCWTHVSSYIHGHRSSL